ncbi:MAG: hypothetical protein LBU43_02430 [Candidatus Accumulibacter sp.]|jgi:predicted NBD/HSP70 family sugar kinase|nr:hypothetical protein [Accumulibacter sp.]
MIHFGIDLGGVKIEIIAIDIVGRELPRRWIPMPPGGYVVTIRVIAALGGTARLWERA